MVKLDKPVSYCQIIWEKRRFGNRRENMDSKILFDPHFSAALTGDLDYLSSYVEEGGDIDILDKWEESMLHKAALNDQFAVVEFLLSKGAKVNCCNECFHSPLHYACISGGLPSVNTLIQNGADVEARDKFQQTPLHCASIYGHIEVVRRLFEAGANIDSIDQHQMSPLHYSSANGHIDIVEFAVTAGANMNVTDQDGKTPLHTACCWGELRIIQFLINNGASSDIVDHNGLRPLQCLTAETINKLKELDENDVRESPEEEQIQSIPSQKLTLVPEVQAFALIEKVLARHDIEFNALRSKTAMDHSRLEQLQARQAWIIDQEVAERQRQDEQISLANQRISNFELILKKTAYLHKEVADQQNRAIVQLQAATQARATEILEEQENLRNKVETEKNQNRINQEKISKLWEDSLLSLAATRSHEGQIDKLQQRFMDRDNMIEKQQKTIDFILEQSQKALDSARESEAETHERSMAFIKKMEAKFEDQERNYSAQEAVHRSLIQGLTDKISVITEANNEEAAKYASLRLSMDKQSSERTHLLALTNKCFDMLNQQQELMTQLKGELGYREKTANNSNMNNSLILEQIKNDLNVAQECSSNPSNENVTYESPSNKRPHSSAEDEKDISSEHQDIKKKRR